MMQTTFVLLVALIGSACCSSSYQNTAFQSVYQDFGKQYPSASQCLTSDSSSLWESRNTVLDTIPHISCSSDEELDSSEQYFLQQLEDLAQDDTTQFDNDPFRLSLASSVPTSLIDSMLSDVASTTQKSTASDSAAAAPATLSTTSTISSNPDVAEPAASLNTDNTDKDSSPANSQASPNKPACPSDVIGQSCPDIFIGAECYTSSMKCFCTHSASMSSSSMFMWSCVDSTAAA